jgi:hypothetical protein
MYHSYSFYGAEAPNLTLNAGFWVGPGNWAYEVRRDNTVVVLWSPVTKKMLNVVAKVDVARKILTELAAFGKSYATMNDALTAASAGATSVVATGSGAKPINVVPAVEVVSGSSEDGDEGLSFGVKLLLLGGVVFVVNKLINR